MIASLIDNNSLEYQYVLGVVKLLFLKKMTFKARDGGRKISQLIKVYWWLILNQVTKH